MTGRKVGEYQIAEEIAYGSMGTIYKGYHSKEQYDVIVKEVSFAHFPLSIKAQLKARFRREAFIQTQIEHEAIAKFYGAIPTSDGFYLVSEYIAGMSLKELLRRDGPPSPNQAMYLCKQALEALEYAHCFEYLTESDIQKKSLIHRDLKPSNLFVDSHGKLKITDFGIVRMPDRQSMAPPSFRPGTVEYMPPEQIRGLELDERSDIYSLGVTFYEVLSGVLPFIESSGNSSTANLFVEPVAVPISQLRSAVPPPLSDLIMTAIRRNAAERYESVSEFLKAIKNYERNYERNKEIVTEETQQLAINVITPNLNTASAAAAASTSTSLTTKCDTGNLRLVYSSNGNNSGVGDIDVVDDEEIALILASYRDSDIGMHEGSETLEVQEEQEDDDSIIEIIEPESLSVYVGPEDDLSQDTGELLSLVDQSPSYTQPFETAPIAEPLNVLQSESEVSVISEAAVLTNPLVEEKVELPEFTLEYANGSVDKSPAVIALITAVLLFVIVMAGAFLSLFTTQESGPTSPINESSLQSSRGGATPEEDGHSPVTNNSVSTSPQIEENSTNPSSDSDPVVSSGNIGTFRRAVQAEGVGNFDKAKSLFDDYMNSNASSADLASAKAQLEKIAKFISFVEAARSAVNKGDRVSAKQNFEEALKLRPYSNAVKKELERLSQ